MLSSGTRVGHYEVVAAIGKGGMGEVYRARDVRLNREVALKLIPDSVASDPERIARFTREAQTLAAVNHPNIAHVYGIEEQGGVRALVMEIVDGVDLRVRLAVGRLPYRDAIAIASQLAAGLGAAHEKGIVHRDLKPANVMIDAAGHVKVLDFGLAKSVASPDADQANSPTLSSPVHLTQEGAIVGTAAYMSPEQATGQAADKRSDIWSFGCLLYELLTGKRPFEQADVPSTLAAILAKEPDWSLLGAYSPVIQRLVRRCLEKDRRRRLADISDARLDLEDELSGAASSLVLPTGPAPNAGSRLAWLFAAAAATAAVTVSVAWAPWRETPDKAVMRLDADLGAPVSLVTAQGVGAILSPDGTTMVFVGQPRTPGSVQQLFVRRLDSLAAQPMPGTEGAMSPFFSPDSAWVGFFAGGKLKKAAVAGGGAIEMAGAPNGRGGSWGDDDQVVFMPDFYSGLWRVSASGGPPARVTTPAQSGGTHRWPQVLPGSTAVIYTSHDTLQGYEAAELVLQPLPTGEPVVLQKAAYYGRYLSSGHLVFMKEGTLFASAFDLRTLRPTSDPVPVLEDVANGAFWTGAAQFSASEGGLFAYQSEGSTATPIAWETAAGVTGLLRQTASTWSDPVFSGDGRRLALTLFDGRRSDIWIYDWAADALVRLTQHAYAAFKPVWTPDGSRVAFTLSRGDTGVFNIAWQRTDGSGAVQALSKGTSGRTATSFHPSGRFLALNDLAAATSFDILILPLEGSEDTGWTPGTATVFLKTAAVELEPMFSPDGRWLAYSSNESGRFEVYVRPFPGPGGVWQVSRDGGTFPTWSQSRSELLYSSLDQRVMSVAYESDARSFRASPPRRWSRARHRLLGPVVTRNYALHPDGTRLAMAQAPDETAAGDRIVFLFNFFEDLQRRVPR
jgi:Tol biopolymer transport system component/aminoglycoside phosphotransferase (APT) family kinase protein